MPLIYTKHQALIECPNCGVHYPIEHCGIAYKKDRNASVRCAICKTEFDVSIIPKLFFWKKINVNARIC